MSRILADNTGTYDLEGVAAVTPATAHKFLGAGANAKPRAELHLLSGSVWLTETDYDTAAKQFTDYVNGSAAPAGAAAVAEPGKTA